MKYNKRLTKEIEFYEGLTHIYVSFSDVYVDVEGKLTPEELSAIASIQRRRIKANEKPESIVRTLW